MEKIEKKAIVSLLIDYSLHTGTLFDKINALPTTTDDWISIDQYPEDSPVVQRWHKIYKCIVSVQHRRAYAENQCEWLNATLDNTWPELAFEPFFKPLPQPSTK